MEYWTSVNWDLDRHESDVTSLNANVPTPIAPGLTLSANQERIWFLEQLGKNEHPLIVRSQFTIPGESDIDAAKLNDAVSSLLRDSPILRMAISDVNGTPQAQSASFEAQDLFHVETLPGIGAVSTRIRELEQTLLSLATGPLLKIVVLRSRAAQDRILLLAHQIIVDRRGLALLTEALAARYTNSGTTDPLPNVTIFTPPANDHSKWWQNYLGGITPLEFPIDRVRPPVQNYRRSTVDFDLGTSEASALTRFAESCDCTIESLLLTAFTTLLYRYTSTDDLIFALSTRNNEQAVLGNVENLVPLRVRLDRSMSFSQLLERLPKICEDALAHGIPFATLLQAISVERDLSRAPLVQLAFTWGGEIPASITELPAVAAGFLDLNLVAYQQSGKIRLLFEYDDAIFDRDTIARIAGHFKVLLSSAVSEPGQALIDLRLMPDEERETVLVKWNETAVDYPDDQCLHQLIEAQVARTPNRIAAISGEEEITFDALNRRANQLAHYLQSLGIQPDDLVGVHLERSIDLLASLLAIMKSGAGYVPLDPNFPHERLSLIAQDAQFKALITHSSIQAHAPKHDAETVLIDQLDLSEFRLDNPTSNVRPDNLIYVIFTSGSTGRPKGVQLEHRSVVNLLTSMLSEPGISEGDALLALATLSFDMSVVEMYAPLITGARVVIGSYEDVVDGRRLLDLIERHSITILQATPATWQLLLEANWQHSPDLTALCGGEALPLEIAQKISQRCKALWNMYGPTETTVWSSVEPVQGATDFIPLGHAINNTTIYVLDTAGNPTPIGVPGELTIGGDGVARGYLDRPELTAEKFVPDPFLTHTGLAKRSPKTANPRMYRTGDIARFLADGRLQFYGRADHQVKVRGFRIELGEIEAVLGNHEDIKQNVVIVREDTPNNKQIVAYLVLHDGKRLDHGILRSRLKEHLPGYMIPAAFVTLDCLPLTPTGKIDRRALPEPYASKSVGDETFVAPRNDIEARLADIWARVLNIPKLGVNDNFFDLGGHSLLAVRIFTLVEKEFERSLPLATLFRAPSVAQFAALLAEDAPILEDNHHPTVVAVQPKGSKTPIFCVGGGVVNMNNLARRLGTDQPFYALQWEGLAGDRIMDITLEEAAAIFVEAIQSVQPQGPYYLSGSFAAGLIAVEIARRIQNQGEKIALLAGFDTVVREEEYLDIGEPKETGGKRPNRRGSFNKVLRLIRKGPVAFWEVATDAMVLDRLQYLFWKVSLGLFTALKRPIPLWMRSGMFAEFFIWRVNEQHVPKQSFDGDFHIYLTADYYEKYRDMPKYGWAGFVSGTVKASRTPGDPCTIMMDPNVDELATHFRAHLERERQAAS